MKRLFFSICPLIIAAFLLVALGLVFSSQTNAAAIVVNEDFEDGVADGWTVQAGDWSIIPENYYYRVVYTGTSPGGRRSYYSTITSSTWTDYAVQAKIKVESTTASGRWGMIIARYQDSRNYYYLAFEGDGDLKIREYVDGSSTTMDSTSAGLALDTWYTLTLEVSGNPTVTLRAYVDETPVLTVTDAVTPFLAGPCALGSYEGTAQFDDVVVTDLGTSATLLSEDFEDGVANDWVVEQGYWELYANHVYHREYTGSPSTGRVYAGSPDWTDYIIQARVRTLNGEYAMLLARYQDSKNYYFMTLRADDGKVQVRRYLSGSSSGGTLGETPENTVSAGVWYTATLEVKGNTLRAYLNGTPVITATDNTFVTGTVGLATSRADADFDDVVVTDIRVFALTVSSTGTGSGSISSIPAAIDCGVTCTAGFESGTVVTLTAAPDAGSTFAGWMGACTGAGDCVVTMDAAKSAVAVFSLPSNPMLIIDRLGEGNGTVTSVPAGIDCGMTCTAGFSQGTWVTLTATPEDDSIFVEWGGACSSAGPGTVILPDQCVVVMDDVRRVTATFAEKPVLTLSKMGNGNGSVTSIPPGIDCGMTCTADFLPGTVVTLTAAPASDSAFMGWGGACSSAGPGTVIFPNQCVVAMTGAVDVVATFDLLTYTLMVNRAGAGMGSVASDPPGIDNCSTVTCTALFDHGTMVTLTATPNAFSSFGGWSGEGCSGTGACTVTMDADSTVTATFNMFHIFLPAVMGGTGTAPPTGPDFSMVGYATVMTPTTGGAGGTVVTVTTLSDLQQYAASVDPYIIQVNGTISEAAVVTVMSNTTIVGIGSSGELIGTQLQIGPGTSNVIIRNLKISKVVDQSPTEDAINVRGPNTHHIWIDHCDLSSDTTHGKDYYDGLLDIRNAVDYVTVSWNAFHDHWKGLLIGSSDGETESEGHFLITYHHNYFYTVNSRMPSNRFGKVHSFNNYFDNRNIPSYFDANTGISSRMGACSRIENDYFDSLKVPIMTDQSPTLGEVQLIDNTFVNCTGYDTMPTCELTLPYSYTDTLDDTFLVPTIVMQNAGVGKVADPLDW